MTDVSKIRLKVSRELLDKWTEAARTYTNPQDNVELFVLLSDWHHMTRHLHRWERVQELRTQFGKAKRVAEIWCIVAEETGTTPTAVDKSCKDVENLKKRIEKCVARLNGKLGTMED